MPTAIKVGMSISPCLRTSRTHSNASSASYMATIRQLAPRQLLVPSVVLQTIWNKIAPRLRTLRVSIAKGIMLLPHKTVPAGAKKRTFKVQQKISFPEAQNMAKGKRASLILIHSPSYASAASSSTGPAAHPFLTVSFQLSTGY